MEWIRVDCNNGRNKAQRQVGEAALLSPIKVSLGLIFCPTIISNYKMFGERKSRKDKVKSRVKTTASSVPLFIFIFLFYRSSPPQILHLHDPIVLPSIIGKIKPKMKFHFQCVRRKKEIANRQYDCMPYYIRVFYNSSPPQLLRHQQGPWHISEEGSSAFSFQQSTVYNIIAIGCPKMQKESQKMQLPRLNGI